MAISAMSLLASCGAGQHGSPPGPAAAPAELDSEATRDMHVEPARLGFDHTLQVRRSKTGVPHEIHDGDTVMAGDRLRAIVVTSDDAYLYLAFCSKHTLAMYPAQRGIRTRAGETKIAPEGSAELVIDGDPGPEVLYLILSRAELSLTDPRLADQIARTRATDCGVRLDAELSGPRPASQPATSSPGKRVLRGRPVRKKPMPAVRPRPAAPGSGSASAVDAGHATDPADDTDFLRSPGQIVWYGGIGVDAPGAAVEADHDGIAVVRYRFIHVQAR